MIGFPGPVKHRGIARWLVFGLCAILAAASLAQSPPRDSSIPGSSATPSVTVAFWNIQWFPGNRPEARRQEEFRQINSVHSDMKQLNPDIIGMEEVRNFDKAGLAVQPLRGFKVDVCANFPPREGQKEAQEVAIASRLQPLSAWAEEWKAAGRLTPPRGFAFAAHQIAPRQLLLVYCVHLKSNRGELTEDVGMRQESIRQLLSHLTAMQNAYGKLGVLSWIVGGDFNTSFDDSRFASEKTLRVLADNGFLWAWQNVPLSARLTLPGGRDFPATCFDHIFYRGATLRRAAVVNTAPQSSDHHAVIATFDLPSTPK